MSTPSGPYDPTPPSGGYPQNPPPYQGYPPYPGEVPQQSPYGQPPYGQQPYGPPQVYPGYPGYPVPPQPQKNSNRTLWIILGVVGGVLVLVCGLCTAAVFGLGLLGSKLVNSPLFGGTLAVTEFCTDEEQQRYTQAYNLFSSNLQSQMTQDQFITRSQNNDASSGIVSACNPTPTDQTARAPSNATSVSFTVTVTRGGGIGNTAASGTPTSGTITLVKEGGSWKIDSIDPSLSLT